MMWALAGHLECAYLSFNEGALFDLALLWYLILVGPCTIWGLGRLLCEETMSDGIDYSRNIVDFVGPVIMYELIMLSVF